QHTHYYSADQYHLTELVDPSGNKLTFGYNTSPGFLDILETVTDADGGVTTIVEQTVGVDQHTEFTITDPANRSAKLVLDTSGNLVKITDTAGIVSTMTYFGSGAVTSLITPYGTNYFAGDYGVSGFDRSMFVTLPTGGKHVWMLIDTASSTQIQSTTFT